MPENGFYRGTVYLVVTRRVHGLYSSNELIVRAVGKRPRELNAGEYLLPLRLKVPIKCLEQSAGWIDVQALAPPDAGAEEASP